jgi:hypothetical protein
LEINRPRDNLYSRSRAFDNAKNLALIAETFLRRTCEVSAIPDIRAAYLATTRPRLRDIVELLFGSHRTPWFADVDSNWSRFTSFDNTNIPADVDAKISSLLTENLCSAYDELIRNPPPISQPHILRNGILVMNCPKCHGRIELLAGVYGGRTRHST